VLLLALQTDVLGVHWLVYVGFGLCGAALGDSEGWSSPVGMSRRSRAATLEG